MGTFSDFDPYAVLGERATMARGRQPGVGPVAPDPAPPVRAFPWEKGLDELRRMPRLAAFSIQRWAEIITDCTRLSETWGQQALDLGWRDIDLFGCNPRPFPLANRLDNDGLAIGLQGRPVIALTDQTATIAVGNGVHWTYRRKALAGSLPIWEAVRRLIARKE